MSNPTRRAGILLVLAAIAVGCSSAGSSGVPGSAAPGSGTPDSGSAAAPITTPEAAMAAVVAAEPAFADVGPLDPNMIGQSAWYEATPASGVGAFVVKIVKGWGDCPAGCIDQHTWTYAVAPDGSVTLLEEGGSEIPPGGIPDGASSVR